MNKELVKLSKIITGIIIYFVYIFKNFQYIYITITI